jgi:hypothetical protein
MGHAAGLLLQCSWECCNSALALRMNVFQDVSDGLLIVCIPVTIGACPAHPPPCSLVWASTPPSLLLTEWWSSPRALRMTPR